jgi:hypothetical protein
METLIENLEKYGSSEWILYKFLPTLVVFLISFVVFWSSFANVDYLVPWWQSMGAEYQVISVVCILLATTFISFLIDSSFRSDLSVIIGRSGISRIWGLPILRTYYEHRKRSEYNAYSPYGSYEENGSQQSYVPEYYQLFPQGMTSEAFTPSRAANLLIGVSYYISGRYGMDVGVTWPLLLGLTDADTQNGIGYIKTSLDLNARLQIYAAIAFGSLIGLSTYKESLSSVVVCIIVALVVKYILDIWLIQHLVTYCQRVVAVYALNRFKLYEQLRIPLPNTADEEVNLGEQLSQFIDTGFGSFQYVHPSKDRD